MKERKRFKKKIFIKKRFILIISALFIFCTPLYMQTFKPFRKLYRIKTKKFEIIFPIESRRTAENLSKNADEIYDKYSKILNTDVDGKIPITITPDYNIFNSSAMIIPYEGIILYDTNLDENFTSYSNNFETVFIHELTHLLTLAATSNGAAVKIFGTWGSFVHINAMPLMMEGGPVSIESLTGFGRANDPLVKQRLRQDIYEGKFKTPMQASYLWTKMPYGNVYYEYGGVFNKYLQDRFGMEKYNEFWYKMHTKLYFSFLVYNSGYFGAFKDTYKMEFNEVWADFQNYLVPKDVNPSEELRVNNVNNKETFISDLDANDDTLYYLDSNIGALYSYKKTRNNISNKKDLKLEFLIDRSSESLCISDDGSKALIVSAMHNLGLGRYIVKEYDLKKKKRTANKWYDMQQARYFKEGIIGISKDLHNSILIYINENNEKEILLPANDSFGYSSPTIIDDDNIALIVTENGVKNIAIFNYSSKTLKYINSNDDTLKYVRYLKYSNNKLLFSYNDDDRFYKLGELDLNNNKINLYTKDFSGGVFAPVYVNDEIYYKGRFSEFDRLMVYNDNDIKTKNITYTDKTINKYEFTPQMELKSYNPIKYLKPWAMWIPLPQISDTYPSFINGLGLMTVVSSPSYDNFALIWLGYDIPSNFLQTELTFTSYKLLHPISFGLKNDVVYSIYNYWRVNSYLAMKFIINTESDKLNFVLEPNVSGAIFSEFVNPQTNNTTAFNWKYNSYTLNVSLKTSLIFRAKSDKPYRDDLVELTLYPTYSVKHNKFALDFFTKFQTRHVPLRFNFYGSYTLGTHAAYDGASIIFGQRLVKVHEEFLAYIKKKKYESNYFLASDLELVGYLNAHFNLSHLYFDNFFASISYRNAYYNKDYMHSVALKTGFSASIPVSGYQNLVTGEPYMIFALNLPRTSNKDITGTYPTISDVYFGFGFKMSW